MLPSEKMLAYARVTPVSGVRSSVPAVAVVTDRRLLIFRTSFFFATLSEIAFDAPISEIERVDVDVDYFGIPTVHLYVTLAGGSLVLTSTGFSFPKARGLTKVLLELTKRT